MLSRFCVVYFLLYAVATQIIGGVALTPWFSFPALGTVWPMREITQWLAEHAFGLRPPLLFTGNSGDTAFHWIQNAWLLILAVVITGAWSMLQADGARSIIQSDRARSMFQSDRARERTWLAWFRVFIRFALAAQMFYYGMAKIIPTQFPPPSLVTLVTPIGNLSLSDLLWTQIGASTAYQIFTGCAEMLSGILLLVPQTTTLGALIGIVDMMQVFALNMTYDFGLKQISFHYLLMFAWLLATGPRRLTHIPLVDRDVSVSRRALIAQLVFGAYLIGMFSWVATRSYYAAGGPGEPRSPLYGIWDVEEMSVDGETRPPVLNEYDRRWRRAIFDTLHVVVFQRTDDSFAHYQASIDTNRRSIALTKRNGGPWRASFTYDRPSADRLVLEGTMDGHSLRLRLRLVDFDTFRLLNSRFRWVRPPDPFAG